jgi:hypothetical protein
MGELFKFESEGKATKGSSVVINSEQRELLGVGLSEGRVERVRVKVLGSGGRVREISMAEKVFDSPVLTDAERRGAVDKILEIHAKLKTLGFPVIPTMRKDPAHPEVLYMTDLTRDGVNEVVSVADWAVGETRKGKFVGTDVTFAIANAKEISEQLVSLYRQTVAQGVKLNYPDALFLVRDTVTGRGTVVLGDIGEIEFRDAHNHKEYKELVYDNRDVFWNFMEILNEHLPQENRLDRRLLSSAYHELRKSFS